MSDIKQFFNAPIAQQKLAEILGKNASSFTASVLQVVASNDLLKKATPASVFNAACMAATLNLPINNSLGFAYIVPFNNNKTKSTEAQFQLGYKGFIQLAQRSGQFKRINACAIYSSDTEQDVYSRLTSLLPKPPSGQITGYIAYFELLNGYTAHLSMSMDELNAHAQKYSQSAKKGFGVWKDNFDAMAQKTVIKLLLSKQAPLSIDMQTAIQADQAVITDNGYVYVDNQVVNQPMPVTMEQMPQVLALTQTLSQDEIFGRHDLNFEQAQMVVSQYQGANYANTMQ
ncbi:MAG: recombinase RecT [Moraxella sp.]|nr:recombinase RecT [Moraxella sp.]